MNSVIDDVLQDAANAGITIALDLPDLIVSPVERLTPELEDRLRRHKAELIRLLELRGSMERLEAACVCIAVWDDGSMRIVMTEAETVTAINDSGTIYSPQDMYYFVTLNQRERRLLHDFKKRFGGTTEWRRK
jgi:hypothetical protein